MGIDDKGTTIYDVAKKANVSPSTVSRVLNNNKNVSQEKRESVQEIIAQLGFTPNAVAQSLSTNRSDTIGFIVPDIKNPYFSTFYYEFEKAAAMDGYTVLVGDSNSDLQTETALLNTFRKKRVDGIVFMGGRIDTDAIDRSYHDELMEASRDLPIVLTSRNDRLDLPYIFLDEEKAIARMISHLSDLGVKSVGLLGGGIINVSRMRREYFVKYCKKKNILIKPEWIVNGGFSIASGEETMKKLLLLPDRPRAVCAVNDMVAVGASIYAQTHHFRIPQDIMVTGLDGTYISKSVFPQITTLKFNYHEAATKLFALLSKMIKKQDILPEERVIVIKPKLAIRASTKGVD